MHQTAEKTGMMEEVIDGAPVKAKAPQPPSRSRSKPSKPKTSSDCDDSDVDAPQVPLRPKKNNVFRSTRSSELISLTMLCVNFAH